MTDSKWKYHGVRVVKNTELDTNTAQTQGMNRAAAITHARAGAEKLWAGTVVIHAKAKTMIHTKADAMIYVLRKGPHNDPLIGPPASLSMIH